MTIRTPYDAADDGDVSFDDVAPNEARAPL
jgi:hypothetical protein